MLRKLGRLHSLLREMKRRNVFRVALTYSIVAWLLVQVAATVFPVLGLPDSAVKLVVALTLLCFPVALLLAWAYELTPEGVRRDAEVAAPGPGHAALPAQPTEFVGRQAELNDVCRLLREPQHRLVTLTGVGGVGKTRLAVEVAGTCGDGFTHGARFLSLADLATADALVPALAEQLGLPLARGEDPMQQLLHFLGEKRMLLVLDNFEQITEGAESLTRILTGAPGVRILATSRERLGLPMEVVYPLTGLSAPADDEPHWAAESDAVRLFVQRALRLDPRFRPGEAELAAIARICRLVEGIPLGVELAAAWTGTLGCEEIAAEIHRDHDFLVTSHRHLPPRHRSLRAVFDWSWRLLAEEERTSLRRLTVFRGGFTREAADEVAGAGLARLSALMDKSLVRRTGPARYAMPEVVRQYAQEKLDADRQERAWTRRLHGRFYAELAAGVRGSHAASAEELRRLSEEAGNLRGAWEWAVEEGAMEEVDSLLDGVFAYFDAHGRIREGETALASAAAALRRRGGAAGHRSDPRLARLEARQGALCFHLGLHLRARELLERSLPVLEQTGADAEVAFVLDHLGLIELTAGTCEEARRLHRRSLERSTAVGDRTGIGRALNHLGNVAYMLGDYPEARRLYRDALDLFREAGVTRGQVAVLCNLGIIAFLEGDAVAARESLEESLALARREDNSRGVATALYNLGCAASLAQEFDEAQRYLDSGIAICRQMGFHRLLAACLNELGDVAQARGRTGEALGLLRQALATASQIGDTPRALEVLASYARLAGEQPEERERALALLALVQRHPASSGRTRSTIQPLTEELRLQLDPAEAELATAQGESLRLEDVVGEILHHPRIAVPAPPR